MSEEASRAVTGCLLGMAALEGRIERALVSQIVEFDADHPEVVVLLRPLHGQTTRHIAALRTLLQGRESEPGQDFLEGPPAPETVVAMTPDHRTVAAARSERLLQDLCEDYVSLNQAVIWYVTLLAVGRSLAEAAVAQVAERHLREYADSVMTIHWMVPAAATKYLRDEGLHSQEEVIPGVHLALEAIWRRVGLGKEWHHAPDPGT